MSSWRSPRQIPDVQAMLRLAWVELKLFLREPLTVVFSLALPLIILFVLGGVFGNQPSGPGDDVVYRGIGAMTYYVPAYLGLVAASVCVISIPNHLASSRERGVLKRFHASAVSLGAVVGAEVIVALVISAVSGALLVIAASFVYTFDAPQSLSAVVGVFVLVTLGFAAFGILLGAVLPTARSAQSIGMLVWFVMLFLGGAGPPPEVLTDAMRTIGEFTPLWHAVRMMHDAWLGLDAGLSWLVFGTIGIVSALLGVILFRWE